MKKLDVGNKTNRLINSSVSCELDPHKAELFIDSNKVETALLSIDIDFFCRELSEWDFGHDENPLFASDAVWNTRYQMYPLHKETDLKHADFNPSLIINKLKELGFVFTNKTIIGADASHKKAYDFFKNFESKTLFNIDAHHDCGYGKKNNEPLNCGNWVKHLINDNNIKSIQLYPKWRHQTDPEVTGKDDCIKLYYNQLKPFKKPIKIEAVFIAQSPSWIPPHFDKHFMQISNALLIECKQMMFSNTATYCKRKGLSKKQAEQCYNTYQRMFNDLRNGLKEPQINKEVRG